MTDRQFCTVMFAVCKGVVLSLTTYMSRTQFHIFGLAFTLGGIRAVDDNGGFFSKCLARF